MLCVPETRHYHTTSASVLTGTPQLSTDTNVTIAVDDLNDNVPRFDQVSYSATTTENDPVGTGLLTVTVTDDDIGVNADVTLSIDVSTAAGTRAAQFLEVGLK